MSADVVKQHLAWLRLYAQEMSAANWRDMAMRIEHQVGCLGRDLDPRSITASELERKAHEYNRAMIETPSDVNREIYADAVRVLTRAAGYFHGEMQNEAEAEAREQEAAE